MNILHIPYNSIDPVRWDKCIEQSVNGCIFGYSWYLNHSCQAWSALVNDDYSIVMPLPYTTFWGLKTIQTPTFSAFLGVFSTKPLNETIMLDFIKAIPSEYKYLKLALNKLNNSSQLIDYFKVFENAYELDIIRNYSLLNENFTTAFKEKLLNSEDDTVNIVSGIQLIDLLQLYMSNTDLSNAKLRDFEVKQLRNIGLNAIRNGAGELIGAYDKDNMLCVAALFVSSHNKAHLIFFAQNIHAQKQNLIEQLVDFFIRKHSEKNITLSLPRTVYKQLDCSPFGAIHVQYPLLLVNRLPLHLRLMKKAGLIV